MLVFKDCPESIATHSHSYNLNLAQRHALASKRSPAHTHRRTSNECNNYQ